MLLPSLPANSTNRPLSLCVFNYLYFLFRMICGDMLFVCVFLLLCADFRFTATFRLSVWLSSAYLFPLSSPFAFVTAQLQLPFNSNNNNKNNKYIVHMYVCLYLQWLQSSLTSSSSFILHLSHYLLVLTWFRITVFATCQTKDIWDHQTGKKKQGKEKQRNSRLQYNNTSVLHISLHSS